MIYHCCDPRRRELVLAHPTLNGIDFIEVLDNEAPPLTPRQRTLLVRFLKPAPVLTTDNFEIEGGERIADVGVEWVSPADVPDLAVIDPIEAGLPAYLTGLPQPDHVVAVRASSSGDYSIYRLRLVAAPGSLSPPNGIDRLLAEIAFSFKVECPTDFDCKPALDCPPELEETPALSYLAKDYQSFRRLMLGRMAQLMPDWRERSPADLGVTMVEALAYTADRLSYAQDAVATEAYLATARRRSSVRRHARLVDYYMHDGGNARAWVQVRTSLNGTSIQAGRERFLTQVTGFDAQIPLAEEDDALNRSPLVFEPLYDTVLWVAHNQIFFYDWGDEECCLPAGATRATLAGNLSNLAIGDTLIFEERIAPHTGLAADADPNHRHAVQLCAVESGLTDELTGAAITEIRWAEDDALPFPLCISARADETAGGGLIENVSHALGNIVLVDHGRSIADEDLGAVPQPHLYLVPQPANVACDRQEPQAVPPRFRPLLAEGPVTQAEPWPTLNSPASAFAAIRQTMDARRPAVTLAGTTAIGTDPWDARRDLLGTAADDRYFVVETERDGSARLRFGDDRNGLRPNSGTAFLASYRVGNGVDGNVGADAIRHAISDQGGILAVRNPLPGLGGIEPESMQAVREAAPYAYRTQERAVTPADYEEVAKRFPDVQRAACTFRFNGHGHTVFLTVDRFGGRPITAEFEADLIAFLDRFRMAGYDLEIDAPRYVALELDLFVCVCPDHFRAQVRQEVLRALGTGRSVDGSTGFFHPDQFSFGDPVYLSAIYAAVMDVEGVTSVEATLFRRRGRPDPVPLQDGVIEMGRLEIAQLENNPNFPERGALRLEMGGGK